MISEDHNGRRCVVTVEIACLVFEVLRLSKSTSGGSVAPPVAPTEPVLLR